MYIVVLTKALPRQQPFTYHIAMIVITASFQAISGKESSLKKHLETMTAAVPNTEPDCIEYTLHQHLVPNLEIVA